MFRPWLWPLESPDSCYLHTLTFKDPEPDYFEARRRWQNFRRGFLERTGKFGVCVPQWGEETGRLHFHLVSSERWDAKEVFDALQVYGFGRYDVRERPASRAMYAARYVGRRNGRPADLRNVRLWSVFGKKFFKSNISETKNCRDERIESTIVAEQPRLKLYGWLCWKQEGANNESLMIRLRPDADATDPVLMNEITKAQVEAAIAEAKKGNFVAIGEYRSCLGVARQQTDFKDKSKKVRRVFAEHRVEFGGVQHLIEERLPDDANEQAIVPPAKSGETVIFVQTDKRTFGTRVTLSGRFVTSPNGPTIAVVSAKA